MKKKKITTKHSLGALEAEIMDILWKAHIASVRDVVTVLNRKRKVAYTTIMTVMSRLTTKGILKRQKDNTGCYLYCPAEDKDTYKKNVSKQVIHSLIKQYGEVAVAQFISVLQNSKSKDLKEWRSKLKKII